VDICSVFHFNRFFQVGYQSPKLLLDILLSHRPMALQNRVEWHLVLKVALLEISSLFLELLEGVQSALFKAELPVPNKTSGAIPLSLWFGLHWWIQTGAMIAVVARFALEEQSTSFLSFAAELAFLSHVSESTSQALGTGNHTSPGGLVSSRGILGADGRNMDMCDPATVGTASNVTELVPMQLRKDRVWSPRSHTLL
jgi:hypothetical protein